MASKKVFLPFAGGMAVLSLILFLTFQGCGGTNPTVPTTTATVADKIYVTNATDGTVSVIDATTNKVVSTITVKKTPHDVVCSPDASKVYVVNEKETSGPISVIQTSDDTVVATINTTYNAARDTADNKGMTEPHHVDISEDGKKVFVSTSANQSVMVIDADPKSATVNTVIKEIDTGTTAGGYRAALTKTRPHGVAYIPSGYLFVNNKPANDLSIIKTSDYSLVGAPIATGKGPHQNCVTPDGKKLYVATETDNKIDVFDISDPTAIPAKTTISVGMKNQACRVSPDGKYLYVTNALSHNVSVITVSDNKVVTTIPVGFSPFGVAFSLNSTHAYVVNTSSNSVSVIDTKEQTVIANVSVGNGPTGITYCANRGEVGAGHVH